ncbi:MAG: hypothetical protein HC763_30210, partial [Hydrococcus sp. CRU_1_1]|nr:hypothetical protein [Hydrococcus sp. CRU_1_1]
MDVLRPALGQALAQVVPVLHAADLAGIAGSGAAVIAVIGVLYFKEPLTMMKAASLALIIAGIVGLQLTGGGHGPATVPAGTKRAIQVIVK